MKINRLKNIANDLPIFKRLEVGATFMGKPLNDYCFGDNEIFMKLDETDDNITTDSDLGVAVSLETGIIGEFHLSTCVVEVTTSLNVE